MSIVLNEREWVENVLQAPYLGKQPLVTLGRVGRYYGQVEGYAKEEIREKLENFLLLCDPTVILPKWSDTLDKMVKQVQKYPLIQLEGVPVTCGELETIKKLEGVQVQRLAFTLLCIAKYWNLVREGNESWVNTADKEIMVMANINTSIKRQSLMIHKLHSLELVGFRKRVDSLSLQVKFVDGEGESVAMVQDFRNLGNQYMGLIGGGYFPCAHCGITIKRQSNAHKYCKDCAGEKGGRKAV